MIPVALTSFAVAFLLGLALTAAMRWAAPRLGLTDKPDGHRKLHRGAIPLGGGLAVFLATVIVIAGLYLVPNPWQADLAEAVSQKVALLLAGTVIVAVGLVDDRVQLRGRQKFLGQLIAISILVVGGTVVQRISAFGTEIDLGLLAVPFTYFWLLGAVNAMNLLDGIDGLASTEGVVLVGTFAALAAMIGRPEVAIVGGSAGSWGTTSRRPGYTWATPGACSSDWSSGCWRSTDRSKARARSSWPPRWPCGRSPCSTRRRPSSAAS